LFKKNFLKEKKGITLIELLVVVAIVGLLAAIVIPKYGELLEKANLAATLGNLSTLRSVVSIYYGNYLAYPDTIDPDKNSLMKDIMPASVPYVKAHYPYNHSPFGNEITAGNAAPTEMGKGWYYNYTNGNVYINSIAKDIKGNIYSTY